MGARLIHSSFQDAINITKKTFTSLKALPPERMCISACLPNREDEGVVEISPEAWQLVINGVKQSAIELIDEQIKTEDSEKVRREKEEAVEVPMLL